MTKAHIVDRIAEATGLTKIETEAVVDGFMQTVLDAVADGFERVANMVETIALKES